MSGRQLAFFPESADEDGDQLDIIEEAGTEPSRPVRVGQRRCPHSGCPQGRRHECTAVDCVLP
jgi:hypothetical protein